MTEKRPHADLVIKYYSDPKMNCWYWDDAKHEWCLSLSPCWYGSVTYEVSEHRPTHVPKEQVILADITFNAPESVKPALGTVYWVPTPLSASFMALYKKWADDEFDRHALERGFVHLNKEDAELHAEAHIKLSQALK